MKMTPMGEPRPETADEIHEIVTADYSTNDVNAEITSEGDYNPDEAGPTGVNMTGFVAEIRTNEDGDEVCTTNGFAKREDLVAALEEADIEITD